MQNKIQRKLQFGKSRNSKPYAVLKGKPLDIRFLPLLSSDRQWQSTKGNVISRYITSIPPLQQCLLSEMQHYIMQNTHKYTHFFANDPEIVLLGFNCDFDTI